MYVYVHIKNFLCGTGIVWMKKDEVVIYSLIVSCVHVVFAVSVWILPAFKNKSIHSSIHYFPCIFSTIIIDQMMIIYILTASFEWWFSIISMETSWIRTHVFVPMLQINYLFEFDQFNIKNKSTSKTFRSHRHGCCFVSATPILSGASLFTTLRLVLAQMQVIIIVNAMWWIAISNNTT